MEYTIYHLYKKAHNIRSPSQQLLFPPRVACNCLRDLPRTVAFVDSFNFHFFKIIRLNCLILYNTMYIVYTFLCVFICKAKIYSTNQL